MKKQSEQSEVLSEQCEVLTYIAKLQRRSTDALVGEILEDWLVNNYADKVEAAEKRRGLPTTVVLDRKGNFSPKSYDVMLSNMKQL